MSLTQFPATCIGGHFSTAESWVNVKTQREGVVSLARPSRRQAPRSEWCRGGPKGPRGPRGPPASSCRAGMVLVCCAGVPCWSAVLVCPAVWVHWESSALQGPGVPGLRRVPTAPQGCPMCLRCYSGVCEDVSGDAMASALPKGTARMNRRGGR
eukprot:4431055-Pyramimonas_sp.AAC.2